jgi:DNA-binding PadR family transcriptional regulator
MQHTSTDNKDKLFSDDALMDFLSKKTIADKTEKMAFTRIGGKMGLSNEQVESGLSRLCAKNLVRKVYFQGGVGYELTPKGKSALEAVAKAETDRITKQLKEAINEDRKAKLRSGAFKKLLSVEDKWQTLELPARNLMAEIEQEAAKLLAATKEIEAKQPLCQNGPESYNTEFSRYKGQIEKLAEQNKNLTKAVKVYAQIGNYQEAILADVNDISKAIGRYAFVPDAEAQVSQLKVSLGKLKAIQVQLEAFDKPQLSRFEELKAKLEENARLLEPLGKPTHEFAPIKRESAAKTNRFSDPEGLVRSVGETGRYALEEKCTKCGVKRRSTPVNIG